MTKRKKMIKRAKLIILEQSKLGSLNIVLFHNKRWNKYVTIGGRVEGRDTFANTIKREIIEETTNTINIDNLINFNKIKYIDWYNEENSEVEKVRIYFLILNLELPKGKSIEDLYDYNRTKILNSCYNVSYDWNEMDNLIRIPLDNLIDVINTKDTIYSYFKYQTGFKVEDIQGNQVIVFKQVINYIKAGLNTIFMTDLISSALTKYKIMKNTSNTLLNDTEAIVIY
jgi:hypothetical protein